MSPVCVVVGVGPGMGLAIARRFAQGGFDLALLARRTEAIQQYVAEFTAAGGVAHGFPTDVSDAAAIVQTFQAITSQVGAPDVLVYNASVLRTELPSTLAAENLVQDFRINVVGALLCAQQVIPAMRARGTGTILLTGGGLSLQPAAQLAALAIGKAGIRSLAFTLAEELAADNIHVATVTIAGGVQPGTHFDPNNIAEVYWRLYEQPRTAWEREVVYR